MKKNSTNLDVLKTIGVTEHEADRIVGGIIRIETGSKGKKFIKQALKLAETEKQRRFIWYIIGLKVGLWIETGVVVKKNFKKKEIYDPSVQ